MTESLSSQLIQQIKDFTLTKDCKICASALNRGERILCIVCLDLLHLDCLKKIKKCPSCSEPQPDLSSSTNAHQEESERNPAVSGIKRQKRLTKRQVDTEKLKNIQRLIRNECEEGIEIRTIDNKGRGIFTTKRFSRGEFVVEYCGDLINPTEARFRESLYASSDTSGSSYMFYFKYRDTSFCVDATADRGRKGRFVNHSRNGNLQSKVLAVDGRPCLALMAKCDIDIDVELTLDYGDRSRQAIRAHPWLAL